MADQSPEQPLERESGHDEFLIVGIGASAGGIRALQDFFYCVPENSGMAYVVILHLSPDHDSKLAEVLQSTAKIPVFKVTEKVKIKPDHVYVVPPNQHLTMEDGYIVVSPNTQMEDRRAPVDIFFRTLADEHGPRAVSVVLSGTGANGSMGMKRIKERGGAAFVQDPREAEFNEMPKNSIATELVDEVLPVTDIPAKIMAYKANIGTIQITEEVQNRPEDQQQALREIFTQIRLRTGHDFSNYKRPTLLRRIERRINIRNLPNLPAYTSYLQQHPSETNALLKDLLISVTNFYRDKKAFEIIENEVLPLILKSKGAESSIRVWVAGCATGEEAYSIAMLCAERTIGLLGAPKVQVFATDIDEAAISQAREGFYTLNDTADVSPDRLRRFFNKEADGYRIRREIREMVMFAHHNVLKDPPFSHVDLIACRNVMIYLNHIAQERVIETFHFALNPGGYLFLGTSESVDGAGDLYATYNRDNHIFQSRQVSPRAYPVPESVPSFYFDKPKTDSRSQDNENKPLERISYSDLHQQLLEEYAAPSVVVNEEYDIVHLTEKAGRYMQITGGELSQNLLKLVKPELRLELRSALYQAVQRQSAVESRGLKVPVDEGVETINIHVRPVLKAGDTARGFVLVLFEPAHEQGKREVLLASDEPVARQLEEELTRIKAQLRSSNEQHEFQAEELKASNEELQAMNEELRSSAEELETSKEELQSINEELRTVNQELKVKIEETNLSSNNLQNLINSSDIGTIFLDRSFRVVLFTPATRDIFNLIPADYGRPLSDITSRLEYSGIMQDAETVLEKLTTLEREVKTSDNKVYLMRIVPYRTDEDRIKGVIISFFEITARKEAEESLRSSEERLRITMESAADYAIVTINTKGLIEGWNSGAQRIFQYTSAEVIGQSVQLIFVDEDIHAGIAGKEMKNARERGFANDERWHKRKDGTRFFMSGVMRPIMNPDLIGYVKVARDMTQQKQAEEELRISEERSRIALQSAEMGAWDWNITEDKVIWNDQQHILLGIPPNRLEKSSFYLLHFVHPDDKEKVSAALQEAVDRTGVFFAEFRILRADNNDLRWMNGYGRTVKSEDGNATRIVGVMFDTTDHKKLELQKDDFIGIASHELKTPLTSIKAYVEVLKETLEGPGSNTNIDLVDKLDTQVDRLTELIHSLLDTTKITEGQLILSKERFSLNDLIAKRVEELQLTTGQHRLISKLDEDTFVVADRERIGQVLTNLLSNAIKYSPKDKDIMVGTKRVDGSVLVSLHDHGVGIPPEATGKIFERFFRVPNSSINTYPGMGLGLFICAAIIHRHGGKIWVDSKVNVGSTFYFTLPVHANTSE